MMTDDDDARGAAASFRATSGVDAKASVASTGNAEVASSSERICFMGSYLMRRTRAACLPKGFGERVDFDVGNVP